MDGLGGSDWAERMEKLVVQKECTNYYCVHRRNDEIEDLSTIDRLKMDAIGLKEFNLKEINGKPINENKNAAWEIIEGAYCVVLEKDPKWHFFYEDSYNIVRCSHEFEDDLKAYFDDCGIKYSEKGVWVDGQSMTYKYQHIFCPMFHTFSMMAINGYHSSEIRTIFDRVYHCFFNHQFLHLTSQYGELGTLWEAQLLANAAIGRAHFTGSLSSNIYHRDEKKKEYKGRWWIEKCLAKARKKLIGKRR